ncbi:MAG TPA: hypothetical protein VET26_07040 [Candidatus Sulfotelmatobacter sp.]|nr:hypothetical protein [Candidatus Sulfotelmatobacter sp.]
MRAPAASAAQATQQETSLETELVQLALRAAVHHPILMAVYAGPPEWFDEAARDPGAPEDLITRARDLEQRARNAGLDYVAGQAGSVAVQLEVREGRSMRYDEMVAALLGVELEIPPADEVARLRAEVTELAARLAPGGAGDAVRRWEAGRLISGESKWDAALEAYQLGRRFALGPDFPLDITEDLELIRINDELWSVNLTWLHPDHMTFQVNVSSPRTPETVAFEVAHNIYPGDYLHLAVLQQHTYARQGHVAASIKLKNAPESVISEGIEELAYLRLLPHPSDEQILACKLEWLRRMVTFAAALRLQVEGRPEVDVLQTMAREGFMDPARADFQLRLVKHPLWGPYQYTYLLGRRLVEEGERRAAERGAGKAYLEYLYSGLHTPGTFLANLEPILTA